NAHAVRAASNGTHIARCRNLAKALHSAVRALSVSAYNRGACGMYRPSIGPVSAIERAIVCMRMPGLADLRQPISRGFLHTATSVGAPGFFYARCARLRGALPK